MNYNDEKNFIINEIKRSYEKLVTKEFIISQKSQFDLVTDIDLKIEKTLTDAIKNRYPDDLIVGEELSFDERITGRVWTIDPIDGTCNMARDIKLFGVQCSLIENGEIVLGVIYLPNYQEVIYAIKNQGCFLNERRVFVKEVELNNSIVSFGDYSHKYKELATLQHSSIQYLYPLISKIRMFGAACIDFSNVALGRTDGCVVLTDNLWDICPGIIICKEAKAIVTNLKGKEYRIGDCGVIVATSNQLSNLLLNSIKIIN